MNLSITIDTTDHSVTWVSPSMLGMLHLEEWMVVGHPFEELVDGPTRNTLAHLLATTSRPETHFDNVRVVVIGADGDHSFLLRHVRFHDRNGTRVALVQLDPSPVKFDLLADDRLPWPTARPTMDVASAFRPTSSIETNGSVRVAVVAADGFHSDDLTGLPLRPALFAKLERASVHESSVVVIVDIDGFGSINARLGSSVGDDILIEFGIRLAACVRGTDFAARLSGDRFAVASRVHTAHEARAVADRVARVLSEPFDLNGSLISISTSIGVSWGPNAGRARTLFDQAEVALDEAQMHGGRQLRHFELSDPSTQWQDDESFADDLRSALAGGQITVVYQPIVELGSGHLVKVEALARWNHPERGAIPPMEFIPLAERSRTINELGAWILDRACADSARLAAAGFHVDVAVNMSVAQLRDPRISELVSTALLRHGVAPETIWIEVTEGVLLDDGSIAPLQQLHDLGLRLVIDDFGTGYATFQYLTRLPFDALKIDTTFVAGLGILASDTAIVRSVIGLARELGLDVVAEGVETESQRAQLLALGCRLGQGWLFARGLPIEELISTYETSDVKLADAVTRESAAEETQRLSALRACKILDTAAEAPFDSVVRLASQILRTPISLLTLLDTDRQWFKARIGVDFEETTREVAFCNVAILHPREPLVVVDARLDDRFSENPMVTAGPGIRSYAGVPIRSREGLPLGTLCVLDIVPRTFSDEQIDQLTMLAEQTAAMLDLRRRAAELDDLLRSGRSTTPDSSGHVDVPQAAVDGAGAVGRALVELTRISEQRDDALGGQSNTLRFGDLELRLGARTVVVGGTVIDVSAKEFDLLAFLAGHAGETFTRTQLAHEVWHSSTDHDLSTVTEHVYRLRSKVESDPARPQLLRTVRGVGYRFDPPGDLEASHSAAESAVPRLGEFVHDDDVVVAADIGMMDLLLTAEPDDIVGHEILDLVAPSSRPAVQARLEMRASGHSPGPQVIALQTVDGTEVVTMVRSEDAEFHALPAVLVSVREIVDAPRLMQQAANGIVNEVSDAVIVTDPELHVLSWNPAAERLYGWSEREVLGHTMQNVVRSLHPMDLDLVRAEVERTGRWSADACHIARDGTVIDLITTINIITNDAGDIATIVAVNRPERERSEVQTGGSHDPVQGDDVHRALERRELAVFYEPVVDLADRSVWAVNVRVRWLRPDGGTWDLADFIVEVELADALGDLVSDVYPTAFLQVERWHRAGSSVALMIDVSPAHLSDDQFGRAVVPLIERLRAVGAAMWLKVRELDLQHADTRARGVLSELREAGAMLAAVGMGGAWSDAPALQRLGVAALEFDASLLDDERATAAGGVTAASVVALGATLGIPVWVDHVIDEHRHRRAVDLGCVSGSGALYGGPTLGDHLDVDAAEQLRP